MVNDTLRWPIALHKQKPRHPGGDGIPFPARLAEMGKSHDDRSPSDVSRLPLAALGFSRWRAGARQTAGTQEDGGVASVKAGAAARIESKGCEAGTKYLPPIGYPPACRRNQVVKGYRCARDLESGGLPSRRTKSSSPRLALDERV
jgi:hypothetical protein